MTHADIAEKKRLKMVKCVTLNNYYMMIVVVTTKEVRMYRIKDGFMQNLHANIFDDPTADIQCFRQDKRHRKCYVLSNKGEVKVLNISNGVTLKTLVPQQIKPMVAEETSSEEERQEESEEEDIEKEQFIPKNKDKHCTKP